MRENRFIQYFPSFLIVVGLGLWANGLLFSSISNSNERKLKDYQQTVFESSSLLMDNINYNMLLALEKAIIKRPDDAPQFITSKKLIDFQRIATQALNKKLENSDTNTYQIINDFHKNATDLLWEIEDYSPIVTEKEIEYLLEQYPLKTTLSFYDLDYKIAFYKNQIYQKTSAYIQFLAKKVGGVVISCCFDTYHSEVQFTEMLKVSKQSTGKLYLYPPCGASDINLKYTVKVNGQSLKVKDGVSNFTTTFYDTSPQTLNVEYEFYEPLYKNHQLVVDTTYLREQFIIHPVKK